MLFKVTYLEKECGLLTEQVKIFNAFDEAIEFARRVRQDKDVVSIPVLETVIDRMQAT
jgi:hypothetical protein